MTDLRVNVLGIFHPVGEILKAIEPALETYVPGSMKPFVTQLEQFIASQTIVLKQTLPVCVEDIRAQLIKDYELSEREAGFLASARKKNALSPAEAAQLASAHEEREVLELRIQQQKTAEKVQKEAEERERIALAKAAKISAAKEASQDLVRRITCAIEAMDVLNAVNNWWTRAESIMPRGWIANAYKCEELYGQGLLVKKDHSRSSLLREMRTTIDALMEAYDVYLLNGKMPYTVGDISNWYTKLFRQFPGMTVKLERTLRKSLEEMDRHEQSAFHMSTLGQLKDLIEWEMRKDETLFKGETVPNSIQDKLYTLMTTILTNVDSQFGNCVTGCAGRALTMQESLAHYLLNR